MLSFASFEFQDKAPVKENCILRMSGLQSREALFLDFVSEQSLLKGIQGVPDFIHLIIRFFNEWYLVILHAIVHAIFSHNSSPSSRFILAIIQISPYLHATTMSPPQVRQSPLNNLRRLPSLRGTTVDYRLCVPRLGECTCKFRLISGLLRSVL